MSRVKFLALSRCLVLTWDLMWITSMGNHGAARGISERRRSSCSSFGLNICVRYISNVLSDRAIRFDPLPHPSLPSLIVFTWWRHQMETFSALLAFCAGNSPVPVNSPHKGQWRGALMFSLIYARINDWVNNRKAGDLRRQRGHYDVIVMFRHKCRLAAVTSTPNIM